MLAGMLGRDLRACLGHGDRDGALPIGTPHGHRCQISKRVRVGMTVRVVASDGDDGHGRMHRIEKARRVGRATVMRDLQHVGAQLLGPREELLFSQHVGVTGQQDAAVLAGDAQDYRRRVRLGANGLLVRRRQHVDHAGAERETHAGPNLDDRDATGVRDRDRVPGTRGQRVAAGPGTPRQDQRGDVHSSQDLGHPTGVVVIAMCQHERIERPDPHCAQVRRHPDGIRAAVDDHASAARAVRRLDQ